MATDVTPPEWKALMAKQQNDWIAMLGELRTLDDYQMTNFIRSLVQKANRDNDYRSYPYNPITDVILKHFWEKH
jgi:hypothetical protein